jgi:hypothetical protein
LTRSMPVAGTTAWEFDTVDRVESRSHRLDKLTYFGCHRVGISMGQVDVDGPSIQLLDSGMRHGCWESYIRGCESLGIS